MNERASESVTPHARSGLGENGNIAWILCLALVADLLGLVMSDVTGGWSPLFAPVAVAAFAVVLFARKGASPLVAALFGVLTLVLAAVFFLPALLILLLVFGI